MLVSKVFWKETAFPSWRAMYKRWNKYQRCFLSVFCDHGDAPAYFLSQLDSHVVPCAGCLNGNGVEQVSVAQIGIHLSSLFCAVLSAAAPDVTAVLLMWESAYVSGDTHVPCHRFFSSQWKKRGAIRALVVLSYETDWFLHCWHLGSLDRSTDNVNCDIVVWDHFCGMTAHVVHVNVLTFHRHTCVVHGLCRQVFATAT